MIWHKTSGKVAKFIAYSPKTGLVVAITESGFRFAAPIRDFGSEDGIDGVMEAMRRL